MRERRRGRGVLALLTLVALVLLTIDYRQGDEGVVGALQRGALVVFAPVQDGFGRVVRPVGSLVAGVAELGALRDRNAALEDEVADLRRRLPSVADLERENAELRALVGMRERASLSTVGARVIGQPPGDVASSVLIDAGADQGLLPGMAVVNADGLVGKLTEVTATHARVELLTSPTARYAVRVADSGESGLLRGQGARPFQLEVLDPEADVPPDTQVVTRTFQASTIPDGLPVGEIAAPDPRTQEVGRYLAVRPYVDFTRLSLVQVVLDAPAQPAALAPGDLVADPDPPRPEPLGTDRGSGPERDSDGA